MRGLDGRVVLITGAAKGMGAATARRLVAEGARVVCTDVLVEEGERLAKELGEQAIFVPLDVTDEDQWAEAVAETERRLGDVTGLVNNAGILTFNRLQDTTREEYLRVIEINQVGVFLGMRAVVRSMRRAGGGAIVNLSSVEGLGGMPFLNAYTASKFAVRGMTKSAGIELARYGIRVNSVHPGGIDTDMVRAFTPDDDEELTSIGEQVPMRRAGQPEEVAAMIAFLLSDDASYSTGGEFAVDGGATATSGFRH
jgi:3alpha(or 20beta)-hydroxysteroid dehydrogenase